VNPIGQVTEEEIGNLIWVEVVEQELEAGPEMSAPQEVEGRLLCSVGVHIGSQCPIHWEMFFNATALHL
jgi:hypothetical protein